MNTRHYFKPVVASALAVSLTVGVAAPAFAVPSSLEAQVNEAQEHLSELYGEAEQRNYELEKTVGELNDTMDKLDKTSEDIEQTEADLAVAREHLSEVISEDYKSGQIDLLSLVFTSANFDDLVSRFVYANKVASYHADVVAEVNDLSIKLNKQKDTYAEEAKRQKELVSEQKRLKEETDQAVAEAQSYYDQLSDELQAQIAAEQEAAAKAAQEEAAAAAAEAERLAAQQAEEAANEPAANNDGAQADEATTTTTKKNNTNTNTQTTTSTSSSSSSTKATTGYEAPTSSVRPSSTSSASAMVAQAYTAIGSAYRYSGYVWTGNPATSAFTCSGLVDFALGRPTNSSWPSSLYSEVQSAGGIKTSISSLNYGDLVFTGTSGIGHVGIYVGDGCFLDSSWGGVSVRSINPSTFIGGGSIF